MLVNNDPKNDEVCDTRTEPQPESQDRETVSQPEAAEAAEEAEAVQAEAENAASSDDTPEEDIVSVLKNALETAEKERDEYLHMAQRAQADYQNFKRRNSAARAEAYDEGVRETLSAALPAIDNLERAIAAAKSDAGSEAIVSGIEMTLKQMLDGFSKLGLEEVPALGEMFDPDLHNAVVSVKAEDAAPGQVLEVYQKGYRVKDRMIRYAMVKVASEN